MDYSKNPALADKLPSSLRAVAPFIEEAKGILQSPDVTPAKKRIFVSCVDHAMSLTKKFGLTLDEAGMNTIRQLNTLRDQIAKELGVVSKSASTPSSKPGSLQAISAEEALVSEANAIVELAEDQLREGMNVASSRNFHTAALYYRVLQSMVTDLSIDVQTNMEYAVARARQSAQLIENFVTEYFEGTRCSDIYDIKKDKPMGKGSYGAVYLCTHKKTGDEFAVKVITVTRINSHSLRKLHLEIAIMKALDHPNIIKLRSVFFGQRTISLVMDVCRGGELFDNLTRIEEHRRGYNECYASRLFKFMVSSVSYIHAQGIVHRDLKLENFLFFTKDPASPLCLIDFGLSKHVYEYETMNQVVGSAYYTAPEVLQGSYNHSCDVWSLGVILYMMLTGSPPFAGNTTDRIHAAILKQEIEFSSPKLSHISPAGLDLLKKMLVKNPSLRISMDQIIAHPFIELGAQWGVVSPEEMSSISFDAINSLRNFSDLSKFKKMTLELLAFNMTSDQISSLREEFFRLDKDGNGTISLTEFKDSLVLRHGLSEVGIEQLFSSVDVDQNQCINYNEFIAAAMGRRISIDEEHIMQAFDMLDVNKTGKLDQNSLRSALGSTLSDADIETMMNEVDTDGDGEIDYTEFLMYWKKFMIAQKLAPFRRAANNIRRLSTSLKAFTMTQRHSKFGASLPSIRSDAQDECDKSPPADHRAQVETPPAPADGSPAQHGKISKLELFRRAAMDVRRLMSSLRALDNFRKLKDHEAEAAAIAERAAASHRGGEDDTSGSSASNASSGSVRTSERRESDASVHDVAESIVQNMVAKSISRAVLNDAKDSARASSPASGKINNAGEHHNDATFKRERDYASFCLSPSKEVPDYAEVKELSRTLTHRASQKELDLEEKHASSGHSEAKEPRREHHHGDEK